MKNILITGSNGFIARNIAKNLSNCEIFLTNRSNLDLLDNDKVNKFFKNKFFDIVIHCAVSGGSRLENDDFSWVYKNVLMVNNLMFNSDHFSKFISFGSGAELDRRFDINDNSNLHYSFPVDPYGLSKNIIAKAYEMNEKFYNIRIFNVFNEDELATRMIKSNINNYIDKKTINIFENKIMDFFYFDDLMSIINYYIHNKDCPKLLNCSYDKKYTLLDIAKIINNLSDYRVEICLDNQGLSKSYYGKFNLDKIPLKLKGLEYGIKSVYENLLPK